MIIAWDVGLRHDCASAPAPHAMFHVEHKLYLPKLPSGRVYPERAE
jgi:hypothetical protein